MSLSIDMPPEDSGLLFPAVQNHEGLVSSLPSSPSASAGSRSFLSSTTSNYTTHSLSNSMSNSMSEGHGTAGHPCSRRATDSTLPVPGSPPSSSNRHFPRPSSTSLTTPNTKGGPTESVKFVSDGAATSGKLKGTGRSAPIRLLSGMQGTVLPEHHGGLPKMGHTAVAYQQAVYVFGGVNAKGQYSNHVFCHEKRNLAWHEIRGVGVVPRGRVNHAAVLVDSKIYIFGGHRLLEVFDDFFSYDITTSRWEKISYEQTQGPGGVFLHCMIHIPPSGSLFVVGGVHHREQNSYLGHLFDIRNHVWSGVPPPSAVNPQHLQLVTAAYHEPSNNVVVIGLVESDVKKADYVPVPYVYLFQPQSFAWRRVETPTAPESPLPFRIEELWVHFLHYLITSGGGLYDSVLQDWMFPLPLSPSPRSASAAMTERQRRNSQTSLTLPPPPVNRLGFLVLNLREMSWSLVLCKFPRKLLAEVKVFNAAERQKAERNLARAGEATGTLSPGANRLSSNTRQSHSESGVLNLSGLSRVTGAVNNGGGVFGQRPPRQNVSTAPSMGVAWGDDEEVYESGSSIAGSVQRTNEAAQNLCADRYRRLVNFQDVPEFTRKFVLVAMRDEPLKSGKLRPMQYMVMHGGLVEPTDYTMLAFKPKLTRIDALAATKQNGQLGGFVRTSAHHTTRNSRNTSTNADGDSDDDNESPSSALSPMLDAISFSELLPTNSAGASPYVAPRLVADMSRTGAMSMDEGDVDAFSQTFGNSVSDEELGPSVGNLEASAQVQRISLLPTLPTGRSRGNAHRFALQYTAENALHTENLLPYANIPVAVLQSPQDVKKWSKNYYGEQRRWLSDKLKDALSEDRRLRRLRRLANARTSRTTSAAASGARTSRTSGVSDELSLSDTDSFVESIYVIESMSSTVRTGRPGEKPSSTIQAFEDQLAMEATTTAMENTTTPPPRVQDFFEERNLEPFVAEDIAQLPHSNYDAGAVPEDSAKPKKKKCSTAVDGARSKNAKAALSTTTNNSKKSASKTSTASTAPQASSSAEGPPLSKSFAIIMDQSPSASIGYERFSMKPKLRREREGRGSGVYQAGGGDSGHDELARGIAQLLLHNGLDRIRADDDSAETRQKKARLRWCFLRALVCTGEASYLMYMASQAQFKMKGVTVSSTPGLVLAPELHLVGPSKMYKVPSKPVPYNVSTNAQAVSAPSATSASFSRFTQVTTSGMVVYRSLP